MSKYRDDLDAARSRIEALERQVRDRDEAIAKLEGTELVASKGSALALPSKETKSRFFGSASSFTYEAKWTGSLTDQHLSEIADFLSDSTESTSTSQALPGSLTWKVMSATGPTLARRTVRVSSRHGEVKVKYTETLTETEQGLVAGYGASLAMGAIGAVMVGALVAPVAALAAVPVLGVLHLGVRKFYKSQSRKKLSASSERYQALCELIEHMLRAATADQGADP